MSHESGYEIDVRRCTILAGNRATQAIGDARLLIDGAPIYTLRGARVGLFRDHVYADASPVAGAEERS